MNEYLFKGSQSARTREILESFQPARFSTTERNAITNLREGMIIFNQTTSKLNVYNGTAWEEISSS